MTDDAGQRIDKWLKVARLFKTRTQATAACESRRIKVNGEIAKPAKHIKPGDVLTLRRSDGRYLDITVLGLSEKSLSKEMARTLLKIETPEIDEQTKELMALLDQAMRAARITQKGWPTKKQRRDLEKFRDSWR
ncbi:RNA-binding S4 domain-containing protein [bacterium]|nr:RNA-binding S4 domain-containing protein [bacterium]